MLTDSQKMFVIEKLTNDKLFLHVMSVSSTGAVEVKFTDAGGNMHHEAMTCENRLVTLA